VRISESVILCGDIPWYPNVYIGSIYHQMYYINPRMSLQSIYTPLKYTYNIGKYNNNFTIELILYNTLRNQYAIKIKVYKRTLTCVKDQITTKTTRYYNNRID